VHRKTADGLHPNLVLKIHGGCFPGSTSPRPREKGLTLVTIRGAPVFIRIFKQPAVLELWIEKTNSFHMFRTYPICAFSGALGPKLKEGDRQAPEGFYFVRPEQMNPNSRYHLSFNLECHCSRWEILHQRRKSITSRDQRRPAA
jgi:hypothetical protein